MTHLDPARRSFSALIGPVILASVVVLGLAACGSGADGDTAIGGSEAEGLAVVGAALDRPSNPSVGAIRLEIANGTSRADVLVGVSSPDGDASIHRSEVDSEGRSTMTHVERLDVPARSSVLFEPGGLHVMLNGITRDLEVGDTVSVTLEFEEHGPVEAEVPVVDPFEPADAQADDHDHGALAPLDAPPTSGAIR